MKFGKGYTMGTWNVSITGNDTAHDLRSEYTAAFFRYDVEEALQKINDYVRAKMFDETDEEEWCNYYYSLADFMWKKGILPDAVRAKAIEMIDSGFGLELWAEEGEKTLNARKKKLAEFKEKLLSPQPPKKKIKPNLYTEKIFAPGDIVAIKLQTAGKPYTHNEAKPMSDEDFHALDGKFVLMQLVDCYASWTSRIAPEVKDYWAHFRLFDGIYDEIPEDLDFSALPVVAMFVPHSKFTNIFTCESSMFYFKKRGYRVLGNRRDLIENTDYERTNAHIHFSINKPWLNPDSELVAAMGNEIKCGEFSGNTDVLRHIVSSANKYGRFNYNISPEENDACFLAEEERILAHIQKAVAGGGKLFSISFGKERGIAVVQGSCIAGIYIEGMYQRHGLGTKLLEYTLNRIGKGAYIDVPKEHTALLGICDKLGLKQSIFNVNNNYIRRKV